jgi:hypothetical protein
MPGYDSLKPTFTPLDDIKSVWEFEKVKRLGGPEPATKRWHCGWCNSTLKGWNATKVMVHLARLPGNNDVKACVGSIPKETLDLFRAFRVRTVSNKGAKKQKGDAYQSSVAVNQQSLAVAFEGARVRKSLSSAAGNSIDADSIGTDVAVSNAAKLTTAIAEFVFCKGLSFSAVDGEQFLQVLATLS